MNEQLGQHRTIRVHRLRSQNFRQMAQNFAGHADAWSHCPCEAGSVSGGFPFEPDRNFGTYDEQFCKQDACVELCGVALVNRLPKLSLRTGPLTWCGNPLTPCRHRKRTDCHVLARTKYVACSQFFNACVCRGSRGLVLDKRSGSILYCEYHKRGGIDYEIRLPLRLRV